MGVHANAPVIIKRKKVIAGGGHHGGAWKVAYADFVTAMMAFFMLMWLLNATTEQQRKGIADYFSPTVPIARVSGGGEGMFGGDNVFTQQTLSQSGTGASPQWAGQALAASSQEATAEAAHEAAQVAALRDLEQVLLGQGGESILSEQALRHVVTRLTDEGLIIEIFAIEGAPLFEGDTARPMPVTVEIAGILARVFALVENPVAVTGHARARTVLLLESPVWNLSLDQAAAMRQLLEQGGLDPRRSERVTGQADRKPADPNPQALRNDRIEVTLLRSRF